MSPNICLDDLVGLQGAEIVAKKEVDGALSPEFNTLGNVSNVY